jgi:hypothetical protein
MIEWNPVTVKPVLNPNDEWDKEHGFSDKVLVRVLDSCGRLSGYSLAKYRHTNDHWIIEGYLGNFKVSHWSSLNEPES